MGNSRITNIVSPNPASRRILITGGAGFLGSHLCERLLGLGHNVLCLDNFSTGRVENVEHLIGHAGFQLLRHDIVTPCSELAVDEIYNLACPASPPDYQADPIHTMKTSALGALNLLEFARERGIRIFQASTSEIYGDPHVHPQPEFYWGNVNPIGPRACYDEGKRCAETLFFDYARQYGVSIKVCRIFNTYGPRMRPNDGRVVSNFIVQALQGKNITIYGSGTQTRSFCYVDDLIEGFVRLMESPDDVTGPINLGNPDEFTIRELAEFVIDMTGSKSRIVHRALPVDDPQQRRPDIRRAREALAWKPTVGLAEGLSKTIAYFDRVLGVETTVSQESAA
ncbi:UDP-glucuronic acid decarboxylase family protein [Nitratireductor luteus]|uniref:UDP-glucuronic acid decarboxylase family protein n=1 Tax=Nitratireductor luteus TaxID=2976980 RepID=UPI00223EBEAD|nr:UDP-glucuronic acid decarboxylase family protein [Nitratireductor luteus]